MRTTSVPLFAKTAVALSAASLVTLCATTAALAAGVPGQGTWETTLQVRDLDGNLANGPEAFYDTALNVTWLRAVGTDYTDWAIAKSWAEQDRFGLSGWRLPTTHVTTADGSCWWSYTGGTSCGYNPDSSAATGSEMAHLFFQSLGNKSRLVPGSTTVQAGYGLTNSGDFQNLQSTYYWSGTEYAPRPIDAWVFGTWDGTQTVEPKIHNAFAMAVHAGDVAAVPEPQTWVLALGGLTGLLFACRRRGL